MMIVLHEILSIHLLLNLKVVTNLTTMTSYSIFIKMLIDIYFPSFYSEFIITLPIFVSVLILTPFVFKETYDMSYFNLKIYKI